MGLAMHTLDIGLFALALWIIWYSIHAASAFRDLRDLVNGQSYRESAFLGLHRLVPVQGRGHPYADASSPPPECLGVVGQGQASVPPLFLSADWAEAYGHHDQLIRAYVYDAEADQVVLRG